VAAKDVRHLSAMGQPKFQFTRSFTPCELSIIYVGLQNKGKPTGQRTLCSVAQKRDHNYSAMTILNQANCSQEWKGLHEIINLFVNGMRVLC